MGITVIGNGFSNCYAQPHRELFVMATLTSAQRQQLWADFMEIASSQGINLPLLKSELRDAFDGLDDYFDAHAGDINNSIPQPARSALTPEAKALMVEFLMRKRRIEGR